jgi:hypothetical protein
MLCEGVGRPYCRLYYLWKMWGGSVHHKLVVFDNRSLTQGNIMLAGGSILQDMHAKLIMIQLLKIFPAVKEL